MNIKELIERLNAGFFEREASAKALLAQQVVIEQMRDVLESFNGLFAYTGSAEKRRSAALTLQPSLEALREHDAEVVEKFAHFAGIENQKSTKEYAERIRKGEA
jgi:hypothetical protein